MGNSASLFQEFFGSQRKTRTSNNLVETKNFSDGKLFRSSTNNITSRRNSSEDIFAASLGRITGTFNTIHARIDRAFSAVFKVLGLDQLHLVNSPFFFQFTGLVKRQRMNSITSFAISKKSLFLSLEERDVKDFFSRHDNMVELLNQTFARGTHVHLDLRQEGFLQVGKNDGFTLFNKERLDNTPMDMDFKRFNQRKTDRFGDFLHVGGRNHDLSIDNGKTLIDGHKSGVFNFDAEAVVGERLDTDDGGKFQTGILAVDFRQSRQHLGLKVIQKFSLRHPSVIGSGITQGNARQKKKGQDT